MKNLIHKDKIYTETSNNLYSFYMEEDKIPKYEPFVTWNKSPIPLDLWNNIKGISASTYADHKSECMVRIFYSEKLNEWEAQVHPQEMSGMTVDDDFDQDLRNEIDESYRQCGTVHHHCSTGAFASGTDEKDETSSIGLHITLGHIDKTDWDIHYRFRTPNNLQDPDILSFFQFPEWINEAPEEMREDIKFNLLTLAGNPEDAPQKWKDNCTKKVVAVNTHHASKFGSQANIGRYGYDYNEAYGGGYGGNYKAVRDNISSQLEAEADAILDAESKEAQVEEQHTEDMETCLDLITQMDPDLGELRIHCMITKFLDSPQTLITASEKEVEYWKIIEGCCDQCKVSPADLVLFTQT